MPIYVETNILLKMLFHKLLFLVENCYENKFHIKSFTNQLIDFHSNDDVDMHLMLTLLHNI